MAAERFDEQKERNMKKSSKAKGVIYLLFFIGLALGACHPSGQPLQFKSVKVFPSPVVGRIVTLKIVVISTHDEADVKFTLNTLEDEGNKIHLVGGDANWQGTLDANQPKTLQIAVCVLEEGSWPIEILVTSYLPDDNRWSDFNIIHLESSQETGRLILGKDYTFSQEEYAKRPTPRPIAVSSECSGNSK